MPREAQRHAVSNGSTTTATSLEEGNLERQIRHSSGELHEVYDRYITVCPYVMQTGLYRLHKPWLFSSGRARFSSKKYRNSFGKSPCPSTCKWQSSRIIFTWCAGGVCAQINRLDIPVLDIGWGSRGWCLLFLIQVTKTADLNMARIMKQSTSNRGFSAIPANYL